MPTAIARPYCTVTTTAIIIVLLFPRRCRPSKFILDRAEIHLHASETRGTRRSRGVREPERLEPADQPRPSLLCTTVDARNSTHPRGRPKTELGSPPTRDVVSEFTYAGNVKFAVSTIFYLINCCA